MFDVTCDVDIVVGQVKMSVRECLKLRKHQVIRIDQLAGADMQVFVHGVPVARGEVMVIDDSTAIRITEVLMPPSNEGA
jgi:flagellar motor switch protein FliN/FliY